jgi:predicted O-linked N-acetylglucosamine transferase (SPINDLY family)
MAKVRLVIAQGPNQMLYSLSVLSYLKASGEYQDYQDILILGGYRADPRLTEICLQISQVWNFKDRITLHGFHYLCLDNSIDFVSASDLLKRILNLPSVDVIFTLRNWQFINEIFLYAYPNAHKICYGELGWLDLSSTLWSNFYGSPPLNPSGEFIQVDEAYPVLIPIDADNAFEQCPIRVVEADFFKSVIYNSAKKIQGLKEYCEKIVDQLGNSITVVLTSYDTEAGYTKSYEDEIECYLSCVLPHTRKGEAILVKGHPRQAFNQSELLANKLCESSRNAFVISDFTQVPIELFWPFLPIKRVIAPMSSAAITLGYLGASELIVGFGENLIRKYMSPETQETILIGQYLRALQVNYLRQNKNESIKYLEFKKNLKEYSQQPICISLGEKNLSELPVEKYTEKAELINRMLSFVDEYTNNPSNDQSWLKEFGYWRQKIAELLLDTEDHLLEKVYLSKIGKAYQTILNSGIQYEPFLDVEQSFVAEITAAISNGFREPKAIQYLLVAMLYCHPHRLPLAYDLTCIPSWLINDYLKFILKPPLYFQEIEEADNYYQYMDGWINYLHSNIVNNFQSNWWQDIAGYFTEIENFIPLYFNTSNLKSIYTKRADIMEAFLKKMDNSIEYEFPERSPEQTKIRVGILASHFGSQTETFATLSVYKHLNRDIFEIILFTLNVNNHRLERYCVGHADAFVQLPCDLPSQVQIIRDIDLDILFIATNITAVTHSITLLALHRLARIQMVDANSPVTTGMRYVDYYISSKLSEPENNPQQHYRETLIKLDSPPQCFDFATEKEILPTISISKESLGIQTNAVVYISGANFYKIIPEQEVAWAKIIANIPNSVLLLYPFNPNWSSSYPSVAFQKRIVTTFAQHGVSQDRLILLDCAPNRADVKERLKLGDIYLDSYPYSGMTSLIDPLEVALPTVVMETEPSRSRKGASLLRELQIPDLITNSEEAYIQLAIALGNNPDLRHQKSAQIKEKMQGNPSFLDSRAYSAKIGSLFQELFSKYLADTLSQNFRLKDINLVIFPDWSQPEELLYQDLASIICTLTTHPDKNRLTLLIDTQNIPEEEADMLLSSLTMNLLMEDDVDITEGPEISLLGKVSNTQWKTLLPRIQTRIALATDNQQAIAQAKAENLPFCDVHSLSASKLEMTPV